MASPSKNAPFRKEYLPGYTGFVPTRSERFGMTSGDVNKVIVKEEGNTSLIRNDLEDPYDAMKRKRNQQASPNKEVYGNWSRHAINWMGGQQHEIQQQHVPGYTGHVKGMISENLYSKSYARTTATAISKKHPIGSNLSTKDQFAATTKKEFNTKSFRRFIDDKSMKPRKDYNDYTKFVNDMDKRSKSMNPEMTNSYDSPQKTLASTNFVYGSVAKNANSVTSQTDFRSNRNLMRRTFSQTKSESLMKPRLLESGISQKQEFNKLSGSFQNIFTQDKKDQKMVIPIAGYGGHRRGDRSQNYFGKSFRQVAIQSKAVERNMRSTNYQTTF